MDDAVEAERDGEAAGLNGHLWYSPNPYPQGSETREAWQRGLLRGVAARQRIDTEWTVKQRERAHRERDLPSEVKATAWNRLREMEREIRATVPSGSADGLIVACPRAPHPYSYKVVHGPRDRAFAFASHVFATDSCTMMYEHMLWKLIGADEGPDGVVTLWFSKSHYAGD